MFASDNVIRQCNASAINPCLAGTPVMHACTQQWLKLCRYVKQLMKEAKLTIRVDPMGNIYGRMHGSSDSTGRCL